MVTFYVGVVGLPTSISEFMTEYEWNTTAPEDFPANVTWERATVADEAAMNQWIAAKNRWLCAAWTPNQSCEEQEENKGVMREASAEMDALEAKARV